MRLSQDATRVYALRRGTDPAIADLGEISQALLPRPPPSCVEGNATSRQSVLHWGAHPNLAAFVSLLLLGASSLRLAPHALDQLGAPGAGGEPPCALPKVPSVASCSSLALSVSCTYSVRPPHLSVSAAWRSKLARGASLLRNTYAFLFAVRLRTTEWVFFHRLFQNRPPSPRSPGGRLCVIVSLCHASLIPTLSLWSARASSVRSRSLMKLSHLSRYLMLSASRSYLFTDSILSPLISHICLRSI